LKTRTLSLGTRPLLMGIVNVTPDSFSDGGQFFSPQAAVGHALRLLDSGADLLDLGGESTRPGAIPLTSGEEQARILPVLAGILKARPEAIVSVDTYHAATAQAAVDAGAEIVNDVSGLLWDASMARVLAEAKCGCILMHTRGRPQDWSTLPTLAPDEVLPLVLNGLRQTLALAEQAGIAREAIVLDPGFGFGKLGEANWTLLERFGELRQLGYPLLAGLSRKRFLTAHLADPTLADRDAATHAANSGAIAAGAHLLRVHAMP
jgi:dihydropteroate synthase